MLTQWIMQNLQGGQFVGEGGVTVGGEGAFRISMTNHIGHGGSVGGGAAEYNIIYSSFGNGGAVGSGEAIVDFRHIIPPPAQVYFKKIRWMPGDVVWDNQNSKYLVEKLFYTDPGGAHYICDRAGSKFLLYGYELQDGPVCPTPIFRDDLAAVGIGACDFERKLEIVRNFPSISKIVPGVRAIKVEV